MFENYLLNQLEYNHLANETLINFLLTDDTVHSKRERELVCHIINVEHIWISRLTNNKPESNSWDDLPGYFWVKLNTDNYLKLKTIIDTNNLDDFEVKFHTENTRDVKLSFLNILNEIFTHSTHHRAQISALLSQKNDAVPNLNFIRYS